MTPTRHRPAPHDRGGAPTELPAPFLGRLVFPTGHGPRSIIVECLRADGGYTIHLPAFNDAGNYLADAPVSLTAVEAESTDPDEVIQGRSRLVDDRDVADDTARALERWSDQRAAHYFQITPGHHSRTSPGGHRRRAGDGRRAAPAHPDPREEQR